jgi:hypothetical protein
MKKSLYRQWMIRLQMFVAAKENAAAPDQALRSAPQGKLC